MSEALRVTLPVAQLDRLIALARREHLVVDGDCWYSCPKAPSDWRAGSACCDEAAVARGECTCGADAHNDRVDAFVRELGMRLPA
jgi:hypothetical protein